MQIITPIINKLSSARVTPAGNAVLQLVSTNAEYRTSMTIRNESALYNLYVKAVLANSTAPTTTTILDTPYVLRPGESRTLMFGRALDVYGMNSSAGATTINVMVEENQGGMSGSEGGDSPGGLGVGLVETDRVLHKGRVYSVVRIGGDLTATGAIVPQTASKFGLLLDLLIFAKSGVTDTYKLDDGTSDLTGVIPLSSDGSAGAPGFRGLFPFGVKTKAANRPINVTIGSGGDAAYYGVYALTDD